VLEMHVQGVSLQTCWQTDMLECNAGRTEVTRCCEHGDEPLFCVEDTEFDQLSD
jgi:hypothetical protein